MKGSLETPMPRGGRGDLEASIPSLVTQVEGLFEFFFDSTLQIWNRGLHRRSDGVALTK